MRAIAHLAAAAALISVTACDAALDEPECAGQCDELFDQQPGRTRHAILYASQYDHSRQWRGDGEFGFAQADVAATALRDSGWGTVEVIPVRGPQAVLDDLATRNTAGVDLIGFVAHTNRGGPIFDDVTNARNTVQFGWTWFGKDQPVSVLPDGGPVRTAGLLLLTDELKRVLPADGEVFFSGCRSGDTTDPHPSRAKPVTSTFRQGTPFFQDGGDGSAAGAKRFATFLHAVSTLTGRIAHGSKVRMSLALTDDALVRVANGEPGPNYLSVLPIAKKTDQVKAHGMVYTWEPTEAVYVATGSCAKDTADCATVGEAWEASE
jgi:hypothetical protein